MGTTQTLLQKGEFFRERRQYDESVASLNEALAIEPNLTEAHFLLALTYLEHTDTSFEAKALESINRAIGLAPEEAFYQAIKGHILIFLDKPKEARECAMTAISMDPDIPLAWTVKGQSYFPTNEWSAAEECLKQALRLDPDSDQAQNILSMVLRAQGNHEESQQGVKRVLSNNAEDPIAHANAGWGALHNGKHEAAEEHFKVALRLSPENEFARNGLRESYKARSFFFRLYLKYVFFMQKFSQKSQWVIMIGIYVAFKFGRAILANIHPALAGVLLIVYLLFAFWTFLANGIGHFILLKDPIARLSLTKREKLDGLFVGGGFILGIILGLSGYIMGLFPLAIFGAGIALSSIPWSKVFLNNSKVGKAIFTAIAVLVIMFTLIGIGTSASINSTEPNGAASFSGVLILGVILSFGSTWLALIPGLVNED